MIKQIRELMARLPFVPFTIHTSDSRDVRVPTNDHIAVSGQCYVIVTHDTGEYDVIPGLHITGVTVDQSTVSA